VLTFVGLGLSGEGGLTLSGLERARRADRVYVELYTAPMPQLSLPSLERLVSKPIVKLTRTDLEDHPEETVLRGAETSNIVLLVPGDPMTATTHIDLRLRAYKRGVKTQIVHGVSILTAAAGAVGLQAYKFGKTVTIPFPSQIYRPETPYDVLRENTTRKLHTLLLLDVDADKGGGGLPRTDGCGRCQSRLRPTHPNL